MFTEKSIKDITNVCVTRHTNCVNRYVIYYKNIPLCETICTNDPKFVTNQKIEVIARLEDGKETEFFIMVTTPILGKPLEAHYNIVGRWYSIESIEQWLGEPILIELNKYSGYDWDGMTQIPLVEAGSRFIFGKSVYLLYDDNSESLAESFQDIKDHCGKFGYEK